MTPEFYHPQSGDTIRAMRPLSMFGERCEGCSAILRYPHLIIHVPRPPSTAFSAILVDCGTTMRIETRRLCVRCARILTGRLFWLLRIDQATDKPAVAGKVILGAGLFAPLHRRCRSLEMYASAEHRPPKDLEMTI